MEIDIDKVTVVRKRVRLDPNHAEMLPLPQMIFVWFAPTTHGRRQRFATDLNRQELLFCAQRRATNESVPSRIEIGRQIVVEDHSLRSWAGMPIEVYIREKAVDMSKHFGHE